MTKKKRFGVSQAISRGLSETINAVENSSGIFRNVVLPLAKIELDPNNPRKLTLTLQDVRKGLEKSDPNYQKKLTELENLKELAITIESSGIINPVVVYKTAELYRVVAGERRCLASILAGKSEVEARIFNEKPNSFDLKLMQWFENTAREDLSLSERIGNIHDILEEYQVRYPGTKVTPTLLKSVTGLSLAQSSYYLTVIKAPDDLREAIKANKILSLDKAALIAGIESLVIRKQLLDACLNGCSLKNLRQIAQKQKQIKKQLPEKKTKPGRVATRINMGATSYTSVAEFIVNTVLETQALAGYSDVFAKVDWKHYDQAASAFRKLIEILEGEFSADRITN